MPDDIQTEIRSKCGDIYVKSRNSYLLTLPSNCTVNIDSKIAEAVVEELRKDESLKKDLRYLIGNEAGKLNDLFAVKLQLDNLEILLEKIIDQ